MKPSTGWALVGAQFGLLAALVVLPGGNLWSRGLVTGVIAGVLVLKGLLLAVAGGVSLGSSLTPTPIPKDDGHLVTTGIYSLIRHPIYTGLLSGALGIAVWGASIAHFLAVLALAGVLYAKVFHEEKLLSERYSEYKSYALRTGRLFPKLGSR